MVEFTNPEFRNAFVNNIKLLGGRPICPHKNGFIDFAIDGDTYTLIVDSTSVQIYQEISETRQQILMKKIYDFAMQVDE